MRNSITLLLILVLTTACNGAQSGRNGSVGTYKDSPINAIFMEKCLQKARNDHFLHPNEFCECDYNQFIDSEKSVYEKYKACEKYRVTAKSEIVPLRSKCRRLDSEVVLEPGHFVVQYREYNRSGWIEGVKRENNGLIWRVVEINDGYVELELYDGIYNGKQKGHRVKFESSFVYRSDHAGALGNEQILKQYKYCEM